ncbi:MAG: SMP-30/gluconolactonase/LRE family protein [Burkholderiaceae bacterium]
MTHPTMRAPARVVSSSRDKVGESPVWDGQAQALYWVDIEGRHIRRLDWASGQQQTWNTPERVGCIALADGGVVVAAMESGIYAVQLRNPPAVEVTLLAAISHPMPNMRFNDGRCDASGRFWVSTMCMDMALAAAVGSWHCLDERGLSPAHCDGLITPNGLAFSPDNATMYFSDSHPSVQTIWASDFDLAHGRVGARRVFLDMTELPGRPDGAAVDSEGCYWICANDAGAVLRIDPRGTLVSSVTVPVAKPSMCAFGGPQRDTLLVTSICPQGDSQGLCGAVFAIDVGVHGLPEPRFSRFPSAGA